MSETYRQHLRALVEHPDEDEPRLAFAAQGQDPDLARFIELQVEAGASGGGVRTRADEDRPPRRRPAAHPAAVLAGQPDEPRTTAQPPAADRGA